MNRDQFITLKAELLNCAWAEGGPQGIERALNSWFGRFVLPLNAVNESPATSDAIDYNAHSREAVYGMLKDVLQASGAVVETLAPSGYRMGYEERKAVVYVLCDRTRLPCAVPAK